MKPVFSKIIWGCFLLLAAVFVLTNQFGNFTSLSAGTIIAAVLAVMFIVQCIADMSISIIPLPLAVLYYIFQAPLGLPYIRLWTLIVAVVLAIVGLSILIPKNRFRFVRSYGHGGRTKTHTEDGPNDNNPSLSVQFGYLSRRLHADNLSGVNLSCNFGAMEVFFDHVTLDPNGAEVNINCSLGAIELNIPRQWNVVNQISCSMGGVDDHGGSSPAEGAPKLVLNGSVSLGGIEIKYI